MPRTAPPFRADDGRSGGFEPLRFVPLRFVPKGRLVVVEVAREAWG